MHVNCAATLDAENIALIITKVTTPSYPGMWTTKISKLPFGIHVSSLRHMCAIVSNDDHIRDKVGIEKL